MCELYRKSAAEFFRGLFKFFACRGVFKNICLAVFHVELCGEFFVFRGDISDELDKSALVV